MLGKKPSPPAAVFRESRHGPSVLHTQIGEKSSLPTRVKHNEDHTDLFRYRKSLNNIEDIRHEASLMSYGEIVEICISFDQERDGVHPPTKWFGLVWKYNIARKCLQCGRTLEEGRWVGAGKTKRIDHETGQRKKNIFLQHEKIQAGRCDSCGNRQHRYGGWLEQEDIRWTLIMASRHFHPLTRIMIILPLIRGRINYFDPHRPEEITIYHIHDRWTTKDLDRDAIFDDALRTIDLLYKKILEAKSRSR